MSPLGSKSAKAAKQAAAPTAPAAAGRGVVVEKPKANIYTVLLILSLISILIGCLCLGAEMSSYNWEFKAR